MKKLILTYLLITFCSATIMFVPASGGMTYNKDTFNRVNSETVGNGWTEVETVGSCSIASNRLELSNSLGLRVCVYKTTTIGDGYTIDRFPAKVVVTFRRNAGSDARNAIIWGGDTAANDFTGVDNTGLTVYFESPDKIYIRDTSGQLAVTDLSYTADTDFDFVITYYSRRHIKVEVDGISKIDFTKGSDFTMDSVNFKLASYVGATATSLFDDLEVTQL